VQAFKNAGKPVKYFDISKLPKKIVEIKEKDLIFEDNVKQFKNKI
jgi:ABC-type uncharacterized transport system ATPase subunit